MEYGYCVGVDPDNLDSDVGPEECTEPESATLANES